MASPAGCCRQAQLGPCYYLCVCLFCCCFCPMNMLCMLLEVCTNSCRHYLGLHKVNTVTQPLLRYFSSTCGWLSSLKHAEEVCLQGTAEYPAWPVIYVCCIFSQQAMCTLNRLKRRFPERKKHKDSYCSKSQDAEVQHNAVSCVVWQRAQRM